MKIPLPIYLLLFAILASACSNEAVENNAAPSDLNTAQPAATLLNPPAETVESKASPNPRNIVVFDGRNYIKKSGWRTPPRDDTYIDESYDQEDVMYLTESKKRVRTNTILYGYRTSWLHSEDFYYEGQELDNLKGELKSVSFLRMSANGKVFMYSISVGPVILNEQDHRDPFGYRIQDRDGDGIFETLLSGDADIVVPDWVLR